MKRVVDPYGFAFAGGFVGALFMLWLGVLALLGFFGTLSGQLLVEQSRLGVLVGVIFGFVIGFAVGEAIAWLSNRGALQRSGDRPRHH